MTNMIFFRNSQMEMEVTKCFLEANNPLYFKCWLGWFCKIYISLKKTIAHLKCLQSRGGQKAVKESPKIYQIIKKQLRRLRNKSDPEIK